MLSNWWYPPGEGNRSSTDDGKGEVDEDSQVMEPDQGNGELPQQPNYSATHESRNS